VNGIWNLVLACKNCNGSGEKSARIPGKHLLQRLSHRNEFLISSNLPLRETLVRQTGARRTDRQDFLQRMDSRAIENLLHRWNATEVEEAAF